MVAQKVDCEETKPLNLKAKRSARNRLLKLSVLMGSPNSFDRTVGLSVKHLVCSHIKHLTQEIGVEKKDSKKMTWIDCHTQTCTVRRGCVNSGRFS